jgi:hypothetical protein
VTRSSTLPDPSSHETVCSSVRSAGEREGRKGRAYVQLT